MYYHGLFVGFLDTVTGYFTVSVVLRTLPVECNIEAPYIDDLQGLRGPRDIYRGEEQTY